MVAERGSCSLNRVGIESRPSQRRAMEAFDQEAFQLVNQIMSTDTTPENAYDKIRHLTELMSKSMRMSNQASVMNRLRGNEDKGIMEHRLIRDLKTFMGDKKEYRNWNEKLINAYVQIKKGSRGIFEWNKEQVEKGVKDRSAQRCMGR